MTTMVDLELSNAVGDDRGPGFTRTLTVFVVWFFAAVWFGAVGRGRRGGAAAASGSASL